MMPDPDQHGHKQHYYCRCCEDQQESTAASRVSPLEGRVKLARSFLAMTSHTTAGPILACLGAGGRKVSGRRQGWSARSSAMPARGPGNSKSAMLVLDRARTAIPQGRSGRSIHRYLIHIPTQLPSRSRCPSNPPQILPCPDSGGRITLAVVHMRPRALSKQHGPRPLAAASSRLACVSLL